MKWYIKTSLKIALKHLNETPNLSLGLPCENVMKSWSQFMNQYPNHLLITCGDWDFKTMLPLQLKLLYGNNTQQYPVNVRKWCNVKVS